MNLPVPGASVLILAFDTSSLAGSVALLDGPRLLEERILDPARRSAQTLAPAIAELLKACALKPGQIRLVATTTGPGSFTGLRVGVTMAKTLAYAASAEVLGLSTLEAIAQQALTPSTATTGYEIQAVLDAQRRELFVGRFRFDPETESSDGLRPLTRLEPDRIVPADRWLVSLTPGTVVSGRGLERLPAPLPPDVIAMPASQWEPQAATIGRLAWRDYQNGRRDDLWKLLPVYLRPSYADEKVGQAFLPAPK
jgi:tRNA threonylcarbamoyladenosine biosynthesis protein TsaB